MCFGRWPQDTSNDQQPGVGTSTMLGSWLPYVSCPEIAMAGSERPSGWPWIRSPSGGSWVTHNTLLFERSGRLPAATSWVANRYAIASGGFPSAQGIPDPPAEYVKPARAQTGGAEVALTGVPAHPPAALPCDCAAVTADALGALT